ncbi:MAG: nuclease [Candidatus Moranbacteria bacterium]|nr:nuclease [Candidatus Moranbacteria bacterium]
MQRKNIKNFFGIFLTILAGIVFFQGNDRMYWKNFLLEEENIFFQEERDEHYVYVRRVIDGDTLEIEDGSKVRYIGIDTPEMSQKKDQKDECFAKEATQKNRDLVEGKTVRLEKDISETDRYGRLLRYVYIEGEMVNELLVREGYAYAVTFPPDVKFETLFRETQKEAREKEQGMWNTMMCK